MSKSRLAFAIALIIGLQGPLPAGFASEKDPVTVKNSDLNYPILVPKNLVWGKNSILAANSAINFQIREIKRELAKLKSKGASKIVKKYVSTPTNAFPDWKIYVPSISRYTLQGFSSKGKSVGTSIKLPSDEPNLASRLVYLKQSTCAVSSMSKSARLDVCSLIRPSLEVYLRAALKTSLNMGQLMDGGGYVIQQLSTCLSGKSPYTVENGNFDCPSNAQVFGGNQRLKMQDEFATRSYTILIDKDSGTATFTYGPRDFTKVALRGSYEGGSVVGFR